MKYNIKVSNFVKYVGVLMKTERAYLKYSGDRKWSKLKKQHISIGKSFLMYLGNRKWKKKLFNGVDIPREHLYKRKH